MSWRDSFLEQARSDYEMFGRLNDGVTPFCHRLHFLRMATEKLAKGYICNETSGPPPHTHFALVRLLMTIKNRPEMREQLGYGRQYGAFSSYVDSLLPIAGRLEQLAPVGGHDDKLNPEYPWMCGGTVQCPAQYAYPEFPMTDLIKFNRFIDGVFRALI
jgi:hypothetical protein